MLLHLPSSLGARGGARGGPLRPLRAPAARSAPCRLRASAEQSADSAAASALDHTPLRKARALRRGAHSARHSRHSALRHRASARFWQRRLIVLRHADAEPRGAPEADAARVLSVRGKREAREVARCVLVAAQRRHASSRQPSRFCRSSRVALLAGSLRLAPSGCRTWCLPPVRSRSRSRAAVGKRTRRSASEPHSGAPRQPAAALRHKAASPRDGRAPQRLARARPPCFARPARTAGCGCKT